MPTLTRTSESSRTVAKVLLDIGAVKFNVAEPFTWVSGIRSPIYCDNRLVNSNVAARTAVVDEFVSRIRQHFAHAQVVAGVATGGIPFATLIADRLGLPMIYVRQQRKEHGLKRQIEGDVDAGDLVVLIEDHISTGGSSMNAVSVLREAGFDLLGLMSIMQYGFAIAKAKFEQESVRFMSLCDLDTVLEVAVENAIITPLDRESILRFTADPDTWVR